MTHFIYKFTNSTNNKSYVGMTTNCKRREQEHRKCGYKKDNKYLYNAVRKYGEHSFSFSVLEQTDNIHSAAKLEIKWIKTLQSNNKKFGYNISSGGESGNAGVKLTQKQRQALSEQRKGSCNGFSKLNEDIVANLRREFSTSSDPKFVHNKAQELNLSIGCIYSAITGRTWRNVDEPPAKRKPPQSKEKSNKISISRTGSKNKNAILTEEKVLDIKQSYKLSPTVSTKKELSLKYGVAQNTIHQITSGCRWKHVKI